MDPSIEFTEEFIRQLLLVNYTQPSTSPERLEAKVDVIMALYPADPSLGSPFNTGNETFGLDPGFKRAAAIRELSLVYDVSRILTSSHRGRPGVLIHKTVGDGS